MPESIDPNERGFNLRPPVGPPDILRPGEMRDRAIDRKQPRDPALDIHRDDCTHYGEPQLWVAYSLAKRLNWHRWHLDQSIFLGEPGESERRVLQFQDDMVPQVRRLVEDPFAARIEEELEECVSLWSEILGSESFGARHHHEMNLFSRRATDEITEDEYELERPFSGLAESIIERLSVTILGVLGDQQRMIAAYRLGELVDRGVRPLDFARSIFFQSPNPEYWRSRRSLEYRGSVLARRIAYRGHKKYLAKQGFDINQYATKYSIDEIEIPDPPYLPRALVLPPMTMLGTRRCDVRTTAIEPEWSFRVRSLWAQLELSPVLPRALFSLYKRPGFRGLASLVAEIDKRANHEFVGLAVVVKSPEELSSPKPFERVFLPPGENRTRFRYLRS